MKVYIIKVYEANKKGSGRSLVGYYGGLIKFLGKRKPKIMYNLVAEKDLAYEYDMNDYNSLYKDVEKLQKLYKKYDFELVKIEYEEGE